MCELVYLLLWIENLSSDDVNSYMSTVCELYYAIYMVPVTFIMINVIFVCVGHLYIKIQKKLILYGHFAVCLDPGTRQSDHLARHVHFFAVCQGCTRQSDLNFAVCPGF